MVQLTVMEMLHLSKAKALIPHPPNLAAAFQGSVVALCYLSVQLRNRGHLSNIQSDIDVMSVL